MLLRRLLGLVTLSGVLVLGLFSASAQDEIVFLSTQLVPIEEAEAMRRVILEDFPRSVNFVPEELAPFTTRLRTEVETGRGTVSVAGGLHGDFPPLLAAEALDTVDDVLEELADRGFPQVFIDLGRLGTDEQYYIPWMQATYVMAAHVDALEHLPEGADINRLSYQELADWAANLHEATGSPQLGFPAGPGGLMHRFFQGYLYPSYTGSAVTEYRSEAAVEMWTEFRDLWEHVTPRSTAYDFMQEPLLAGEVLLAWDHTARLLDALSQRPDDFVAFPAPAGPEGRGFMPVLAGLAIPALAPDRDGAVELIGYLTDPETQIITLQEVGFFPVVDAEVPADLPAGVQLASDAISEQAGADDALASLLPVGLGGMDGEFNAVYRDTFTRIIIRGEDIEQALDTEAANLRRIMDETGAPCWPPDDPELAPCPVN